MGDDEVHVERSAVTNESQEQSNQPLKIEIVNKKPASPNLNNSISEHSYSFNTEKPNFSNMALVAMALQNLPEKRGTVFEIIDWIIGYCPYFATLDQEKFYSTIYGVMTRKPFIKIDNYGRGGKFRIDFT